MSEQELIGNFLNVKGYDSFSKENRKSCLTLALKEARRVAGRDEDGKPKWETSSIDLDDLIENINWHGRVLLGLTSYLIILEMIGSVVRKGNSSEKHIGNGIPNALNNFSDIHGEKAKGLDALRNSLAHSFSLSNNSSRFIMDTTLSEIIMLPELSDNCQKNTYSKDEKYSTKVNPLKIVQLVEAVYEKVVNEFQNSNLEFVNRMNEDKLLVKYTII